MVHVVGRTHCASTWTLFIYSGHKILVDVENEQIVLRTRPLTSHVTHMWVPLELHSTTNHGVVNEWVEEGSV